jgi:hypothetical protein
LINFPDEFNSFENVLHQMDGFAIEVELITDERIEQHISEIVASLIENHPQHYLSEFGKNVGLFNTCGGCAAPVNQLWGQSWADHVFYWWQLQCPTVVKKLTEITADLKLLLPVYARHEIGYSPDTFFAQLPNNI